MDISLLHGNRLYTGSYNVDTYLGIKYGNNVIGYAELSYCRLYSHLIYVIGYYIKLY